MTLHVEVDWDRDSTFTAVGDDVTEYVVRTSPLAVSYGRDQLTALSPMIAGSGGFTLDNSSLRFSPRNTASPLYGKIRPARPVRVTREVDGVTYALFDGHTDDNPINPDLQSQTVGVTLVDWLGDFRGQNISTGLYRDLRTGDLIGRVLDMCGWPSDLRDLDLGATMVPWWWEDGTDALTALENLVRCEGPPALLTVGGDGEIVFRDRHHRLTDAASLTSQGTWRDKGTLEPVMQTGFTYDESWGNIVNTGTISVDIRRPQPLQHVWSSDTDVSLSANEVEILTVVGTDPFFTASAPVEETDYILLSGSVTMRLIRSSGISTGIEMTAGASGARITRLSMRARPVIVTHTVQVTSSNSGSITDYGRREFPGELPWCGVGDARAVLETTIAQRSWPLPIVTTEFLVGRNEAKAAAILSRDLSDRVRIIEPKTFLDDDFHIESISHEMTGEHDHKVTVGLEMAAVPVDPVFRFDVAGAGFNDGKFGSGLSDPANMFRFDVAGQGFNQGVFAY